MIMQLDDEGGASATALSEVECGRVFFLGFDSWGVSSSGWGSGLYSS